MNLHKFILILLCCNMFCVLYVSFVGFKLLPQLSFDFSYHIMYKVLYDENEPNFNKFGFYQLVIGLCDKVNKCETNYSRRNYICTTLF